MEYSWTIQPVRLYSPHTTFLRQSGQSQELATALCSLLLGLGYDAYVVFGYATRDVTLRIMSRVDSPYTADDEEETAAQKEQKKVKYEIKPPRDLRSKFLIMMEQREVDKVKAEEQRLKDVEKQRREEEEKPPFDEIAGTRIHFWVLIRTEGREIEKPIFIEPSTGTAHDLGSPNYTGIESVWNNSNYWINMQDCSSGLGLLDYNLHDVKKWEHLLIGEPISWRETKVDLNMEEEEIEIAKIMEEKHLDMPMPWSLRINIPHSALEQKFPDGMQKTWYKRTVVEEFAPYVQYDGLTTKITRFKDFECTEFVRIEERYENRADKMLKIVYDFETDVVTEYFGPGREDAVIKHSYINKTDGSEQDNKRRIKFNHNARFDGLVKLEFDAQNLVEHYIARDDLFYFRETKFAKRGSPPPGILEGPRKIILNFVEKFERNINLPAHTDIAVREFALIDREIHLRYHFGDGRVTASTRNFIKPAVADTGESTMFNPELTNGYQAEIGAKPPRQLMLFLLFQKMLYEEEKSIVRIREIEDLITEFLALRDHEIAFPNLKVSLFNRQQNEEFRLGMLEKEKEEKEHKEKEVEDEMNYLSPYFATLKEDIENLSYAQCVTIHHQCLADFKQHLLDRAIDIQKQFERWTEYLKERQAWYHVNQDTVEEEEEVKYFQEINELNFLLQSYEIRLARHRDLSPSRYESLVRYLDSHLPTLNREIKKEPS